MNGRYVVFRGVRGEISCEEGRFREDAPREET